ncbi:hypothetical protein [Sulfobacillus harzensis]|uniref:Uncharacterized protein n=1 Tax=Sulfobacillus harzensis TaxID=2729629 RepID=A0A7Y0L9D5_9FIRM|nr:hypothetical protein [Sulfobacillus harzensis]NMP24354.1 hypothetical protein [Sulfobacillus harzensis]
MKIQLSPALEQALVAELNSRRVLNERYIRYLDVMEAYWESQTPRRYRQPRPEALTGQDKPTKHQVDIPAMDMGGLGDLFLGLTAPLDPDDLPDDHDDDLVPV